MPSQRILTWANERGCQSVVAASTAAIYGDINDIPFKETDTPDPLSPYAEYKLEMEDILDGYHVLQCNAQHLDSSMYLAKANQMM